PQRVGARLGFHTEPPRGRPGAGLPASGHLARGGAAEVRVPPGRFEVRGASPRRHRPGPRPDLRDRGGSDLDPPCHRLPHDDPGPGPDDESALRRRGRPPSGPGNRAVPAAVIAPRRLAAGADAGAWESILWIGTGLMARCADYLVSPSGRFILVFSAGSKAAADEVKAALAGRILAEIRIDDR